VIRNACGEHLLDSYSPERSGVGDEVLKQAGRLTAVGTLKNPTLQSIRNLVGHLMFGLSAVQHAFADSMTEVAIGYPNSPLNAHSAHAHDGPKPGERAPIREHESAAGSGNSPRFALFAEDTPASRSLLSKYLNLVEPSPRKPYANGGIWVVRPDGYVALVTKHDAWDDVDAYLSRLAKPADCELSCERGTERTKP
jgi:hypothetical protein